MQTNFLVIGSGISGLNFALHAAEKGRVLIVTKKKIIDSGTNFAQGGIAALLDKTDNIRAHVKDTLEAGAYHNNKKAVEFMVKNSTAAIERLIKLGVEFARENGELKLTREGGHNKRRIAYVGDYTGREIERILVKRVKENKNITILEDAFALKLIINKNTRQHIAPTCLGALIIHKNKVESVFADQTILATGGIGQLFEYTTNPPISTGDGIALGMEAGCKTRDLEFIQFHPTALAKDTYPRFLISETVRGEGARLVNSKGEYFMEKVHPLKDLASRDIVAREIYAQLKKGPVYLDCRQIAGKMADRSGKSEQAKVRPLTNAQQSAKILQARFPQIYKELLKHGYHMEKDLIPVTPAAHYICGGLVTDLHGRVGLRNLFAFGEVTCTDVHGANRLASNSLLEALVFSNQIVKRLETNDNLTKTTKALNLTPGSQLTEKEHAALTKISRVSCLTVDGQKVIPGPAPIKASEDNFSSNKSLTGDTFKLIPQNSAQTKTALALRQQIKHLMWQYAGIIRNRREIKEKAIPEMKKIIKKLEKLTNIDTFPGTEISTNQIIAETQNMAQVSLLILKAAYKRKASLGCHYTKEPTPPKAI